MKKTLFLVLITVFFSCDKTFKAPKPDRLLEKQQMEDVLYDIKFLAAAKSKSYNIFKNNNLNAASIIYEKYKIDSITLYQNIAYYSTNSFKTYKKMEHNIQLRFKAEKEKIDAKLREKDSVRINKKKKMIQQRKNKKTIN